jgi:ABC-2 type transport system ATP-binding protein
MIVVDHVTKSYGKATVVADVSFTAEQGRVTGFLGPNGSGKSTTLKVLLGLARPDSGSATIDGRPYAAHPDPARLIGVMIEPNAYHPGRSGRDHLRIMADTAGLPRARVDDVLGRVGLGSSADQRVREYSLGMRQRLGLAAALLGDPGILVLDEPGNGLDPQGLRWLRDLLRRHADRGGTVLVSSHLLAEMEHMADDLVVLSGGKLITSGTVSELQERQVTVRSSNPEQLEAALVAMGGKVEPAADGAATVRGMAMHDIGQAAFDAGIAVHELSSAGSSLEEQFLRWTESSSGLGAQEEGR